MSTKKTQQTSNKTSGGSYLNHYFDHIYVVNLKHNISDRLKVIKHLRQYEIDFEIFKATDGYTGEALERYKQYQDRELGNLDRYSKYSEDEIRRGHAYIESPGAIGYIYTYLRILKDAKQNGYKRFLIFEDDILLSKNFENKFKSLIQNIDDDWKILQLGVSQYGWDSIDIRLAEKKGFYHPIHNSDDDYTYGSFAVAFDTSIIGELIEAESAFESSFDFLPMGELYERYPEKCFVAYPNIVMPDVAVSTIRNAKNQYTEAKKRKWPIEDFDYPASKPSISVMVTSKNNLKNYPGFSKRPQLPFDLRLFFHSDKGIRPLHNTELLDDKSNTILPPGNELHLPESDFQAMIGEEDALTEQQIVKFIEYQLGIRKKNTSSLKEIKTAHRNIIKDRISVIISACKGSKKLEATLTSVITQKYPDTEIIVIIDKKMDSVAAKETEQLILKLNDGNSHCSIVLLKYPTDRNPAAARNVAFMHSTGEYICFLDDSSCLLPAYLSKSITRLKTTIKTEGAVYCKYTDDDSVENLPSYYKKDGNLISEILLLAFEKEYLLVNTIIYKREVILSLNGFDETYRYYHDFEFHSRYFESYAIAHIDEVLIRLDPEPSMTDGWKYDLSILAERKKLQDRFFYIAKSIIESKLMLDVEYAEKVAHSKQQSEHIKQQSEHIKKQSDRVKEQSEHIKKQSEHIKKQSEHIKKQSEHIKKQSERVKEQSEHIKKQSTWIKKQEEMIDSLEEEIESSKNRLSLLSNAIQEMIGKSLLRSPTKKIKSYKKLIEVWQNLYKIKDK